jgi:hypothetical protein
VGIAIFSISRLSCILQGLVVQEAEIRLNANTPKA